MAWEVYSPPLGSGLARILTRRVRVYSSRSEHGTRGCPISQKGHLTRREGLRVARSPGFPPLLLLINMAGRFRNGVPVLTLFSRLLVQLGLDATMQLESQREKGERERKKISIRKDPS